MIMANIEGRSQQGGSGFFAGQAGATYEARSELNVPESIKQLSVARLRVLWYSLLRRLSQLKRSIDSNPDRTNDDEDIHFYSQLINSINEEITQVSSELREHHASRAGRVIAP